MTIISLCIALLFGVVVGGGVMHNYMVRHHRLQIILDADRQCAFQAQQIDGLRDDLSLMNSRLLALNGMVDVNPWASPGHLGMGI